MFSNVDRKEIIPSQTQLENPTFYLVNELYNQYRDV